MLVETDIFGNTVDKVKMSIDRLKAFEPQEGYYLAFSGGKDSVVILELAKNSGVKFDAHYNLTTVDPPELVRFIKTFPEVKRHRPELTMWQLIVHKGILPTRQVRYCCQVLKEGGGPGRKVITGVRWGESYKRSRRKLVEQCMKDRTKTFVNPIIDWTTSDVWEYIRFHNLRYCSLYDEGWKRIGCVMCPMSVRTMKKEAARWPKIANAYKRAINKAHAKRIADGKATKFSSGESWYNNWIAGGDGKKEDPDQTVMFE